MNDGWCGVHDGRRSRAQLQCVRALRLRRRAQLTSKKRRRERRGAPPLVRAHASLVHAGRALPLVRAAAARRRLARRLLLYHGRYRYWYWCWCGYERRGDSAGERTLPLMRARAIAVDISRPGGFRMLWNWRRPHRRSRSRTSMRDSTLRNSWMGHGFLPRPAWRLSLPVGDGYKSRCWQTHRCWYWLFV